MQKNKFVRLIFFLPNLAFPTNYPARTCIQAGRLPMNALVEIEAIALTGDVKTISSSQ